VEAEGASIDRSKPRGFVRIWRAFGASARGFAALVIPLGLWLGHGGVERALLIAPVLLILIIELVNSAIEATVDRIGYERHALAGLAKDLGSAAVFMAFVLLGVVWLLVLCDR